MHNLNVFLLSEEEDELPEKALEGLTGKILDGIACQLEKHLSILGTPGLDQVLHDKIAHLQVNVKVRHLHDLNDEMQNLLFGRLAKTLEKLIDKRNHFLHHSLVAKFLNK